MTGLLSAFILAIAFTSLSATEDLVPTPRNNTFYDLTWAKALEGVDYFDDWAEWDGVTGLDGTELRYREIARVPGTGWTTVYYEFRAFSHPFVDTDATPTVLPWKQFGALCLPPMADVVDGGFAKRGVMLDIQAFDGYDPPHPFNSDYLQESCERITGMYKVPFFIHGWDADVVDSLFSKNYHQSQLDWADRVLDDFDSRNVTDVEDFSGNQYERVLIDDVLAKANMVALTAFQRFVDREVDQSDECDDVSGSEDCSTGKLEKVAAAGMSKSGRAMWILGAVDDRVDVLVPMGFLAEDRAAYIDDIVTDWDCDISHIPSPDQDLYESILRIGDWVRETAAGQHFAAQDSVLTWQNELYPTHILIGGDIGKPGFHDNAFPVMAENDFLNGFTHSSWRYARFFDDNSSVTGSDPLGATWRSNLLYAADLLVGGALGPGTPSTSITTSSHTSTAPCTNSTGCTVTLSMTAPGLAASTLSETVLLYLKSTSRHRRDATTAAQWQSATTGQYTSPGTSVTLGATIGVAQGEMLTYMWVMRQATTVNSIPFWKTASSIPKEAYPLANNTCALPDWRP
jgi:hypothetical protein